MFLIPYKRQSVDSTLSVAEFQERIGQYIKRGVLAGHITNGSFEVFYVTRWQRDTYRPWIHGHIMGASEGTNVRIRYSLHPIAMALMACFAGLAAWFAITKHDWSGIWFVVVFHLAMYLISFEPQVRRVEAFFRSIS